MYSGLYGDGVLAKVTFTPIKNGIGSLNITDIILGDNHSQQLPTDVDNATVTVSIPCHTVDEDCNFCIEIEELMDYIAHWKYDSTAYLMRIMMEAISIWKYGGCT